MKRSAAVFLLSLVVYVFLMIPFAGYLKDRPVVEKLGYIPSSHVLKLISADQKAFMGSNLVMKVLFYYGGLLEARKNKIELPINYDGMIYSLKTATQLDPYNMDAYYFAQAILASDEKRLPDVNSILEHGLLYRGWDFYLPFFLGFNNAYFLGDAKAAAPYYQRAADLTGYDLFTRLAGRYMYESGQTDLAIMYLRTMIKSSRSEAVTETLKTRLIAFEAVREIELARDAYNVQKGLMPHSLEDLVAAGVLASIPTDPYGGKFYLDENSQVKTSSMFSYKLHRN